MSLFKKLIPFILAYLSWFAIIAQFVLTIQNRTVPVGETIVRFFSYFTILTNILVAATFTILVTRKSKLRIFICRNGNILTAITVYILIIGLVYNTVLRYLWQPKGFQIVVDELLHTVIPLLCLNFWWEFVSRYPLRFHWAFSWLLYPLLFLFYTLIHGRYSGFYPYPFLDVNIIGYKEVFINSLMLMGCFLIVSWILIAISRKRNSRQRNTADS